MPEPSHTLVLRFPGQAHAVCWSYVPRVGDVVSLDLPGRTALHGRVESVTWSGDTVALRTVIVEIGEPE